jgi:hypothetical protein
MTRRPLCTLITLLSCAIPVVSIAGDSAYERYGACLKAQLDAAGEEAITADAVKTRALQACEAEHSELEASFPPAVATKLMPEVDARVDAAFAKEAAQ